MFDDLRFYLLLIHSADLDLFFFSRVPLCTQSLKFSSSSSRSKPPRDPYNKDRVGNIATVKSSLSEGRDSGVSSRVSKAPERQLSSVVQSRAQAEAKT